MSNLQVAVLEKEYSWSMVYLDKLGWDNLVGTPVILLGAIIQNMAKICMEKTYSTSSIG